MAIPTDQTATLIVTEALKKAGYRNPSAALKTRATDEWLRRTLQLIAKNATLVLYEQTETTILSSYVSRIAAPANLDSIQQINFYTGKHTGALQAATMSSVTLASAEDADESFIKGKLLFVLTGNAINTAVRLTSHNETTKLSSIVPDFTTTPAATDTYLIADTESILQLLSMDAVSDNPPIGNPDGYHVFGTTPFKEIVLNKMFDDNNFGALKMRYTVSPHKVDLTDTRMTSIYNELQSELTQGVVAMAYEDKGDSRFVEAKNEFRILLEEYKIHQNIEKYSDFEMTAI